MKQEVQIKQCTICNVWQPLNNYHKRAASKDGLQPLCKQCKSERDKRYIDANPERKEKRKKRTREWQQKNPERYKKHIDDWKSNNKNYKKYLDKKYSLWTHYRLTVDEYIEMLQSQNYSCKICKRKTKLYVDHNHACCPDKLSCGKCVRGLLCARCNMLVGMIEKDISVVETAIEYSKNFESMI